MDTAIISGASAIGGALVGALGGGIADWRLERHRGRLRAKAGARLLRAELSISEKRLTAAIRELHWWPFYRMSMQPWNDYRDVMAEELGTEHWTEVSQSVIELQALDDGMRTAPTYDPARPLQINMSVGTNMINLRANAIRAFNALADLAEDDEKLSLSDPPEIGEAV